MDHEELVFVSKPKAAKLWMQKATKLGPMMIVTFVLFWSFTLFRGDSLDNFRWESANGYVGLF